MSTTQTAPAGERLAAPALTSALLSKAYGEVAHRIQCRAKELFAELSSIGAEDLLVLRLSEALAIFAPRLAVGHSEFALVCSTAPGYVRVSAPVAGAAVTAAAVVELRGRLPDDIDEVLDMREQALRAWLAQRVSERDARALQQVIADPLRPVRAARKRAESASRARLKSLRERSEFSTA